MTDIKEFIAPGRRIFISGIGGVSTSALADLLRMRGVKVSGSDARQSAVTDRLVSLGVTVHIGHSAENLADAECVVRSAAIHDSNPEISGARARGIPVYERADAWGAIMLEFKGSVCIAGTHGKTTTTGFAAQVAGAAGLDPTVTVGGCVPGIGTHRVGAHDLIIAESCEYCNSFLRFRPTTAVVLNIEEDHLDFFSGLEEIKQSFEHFCRLVPASGRIAVCIDTPNSRALYDKFAAEFRAVKTDAPKTLELDEPPTPRGFDSWSAPRTANWSAAHPQLVAFSTSDTEAPVRAENITVSRGRYSFDLVFDPAKVVGETTLPAARERVTLSVVGEHNVTDALGAAASLWGIVPPDMIASALSEAGGAGRRFEFKGKYAGAEVYDDYAHHPSEIEALFSAARSALEGSDGRLVVVFHPHTYSRTKAFRREFAEVLGKADECCILPIYAAREDPDPEISSEMLAADCGAHYADSFEAAADWARSKLREGDLLVTVGAGEAFKVGNILLG